MPRSPHRCNHTARRATYRDLVLSRHDRGRLIRLILTTWTGPGEPIADLDNDSLAEAHAAGAGRRYFPPGLSLRRHVARTDLRTEWRGGTPHTDLLALIHRQGGRPR